MYVRIYLTVFLLIDTKKRGALYHKLAFKTKYLLICSSQAALAVQKVGVLER